MPSCDKDGGSTWVGIRIIECQGHVLRTFTMRVGFGFGIVVVVAK